LYRDADGFPFESTGPWSVEKGITPRMVLYVCVRRHLSCHGFWEDRKILQHVEPRDTGGHGCVCFSFSNGHFYLLDEDVSRSLSHVSFAAAIPTALLHVCDARVRSNAPTDAYPGGELPIGSFFVESPAELLAIRASLLRCNRVPRMKWLSLRTPKSLLYVATKKEIPEGDRKLYVRVVPPERRVLEKASEQLGLEYGCESLGPWALRAFEFCLRGQRRDMSSEDKQQLLRKQYGRCRHCSVSFSDDVPAEFHHESSVNKSLEAPIWIALCGECHAEVTSKRAKEDRGSPSVKSHLSDELWDALVSGPAPLSLVLQVEDPPAHELSYVDRRRSRQNILLNASCSWPVALPSDCVEPFGGILGDFNFGRHRRRAVDGNLYAPELLRDVPLRGDGWYHGSLVRYCLDVGVISKSDIEFRCFLFCARSA